MSADPLTFLSGRSYPEISLVIWLGAFRCESLINGSAGRSGLLHFYTTTILGISQVTIGNAIEAEARRWANVAGSRRSEIKTNTRPDVSSMECRQEDAKFERCGLHLA